MQTWNQCLCYIECLNSVGPAASSHAIPICRPRVSFLECDPSCKQHHVRHRLAAAALQIIEGSLFTGSRNFGPSILTRSRCSITRGPQASPASRPTTRTTAAVSGSFGFFFPELLPPSIQRRKSCTGVLWQRLEMPPFHARALATTGSFVPEPAVDLRRLAICRRPFVWVTDRVRRLTMQHSIDGSCQDL